MARSGRFPSALDEGTSFLGVCAGEEGILEGDSEPRA